MLPVLPIGQKVLLVEGKDEVNFFGALLKHLGLSRIELFPVGGKDKFPSELRAILNLPSFDQVSAYAIIRVEHFVQCLQAEGQVLHPKNTNKARMQVYLAAMHETVTSVGLAAQKGYWHFEHEALADLRHFLKRLAE